MTKHVPPSQFKPPLKPYSYVGAHNCFGGARPHGDMYSAVAVIAGYPVWLGTYPSRREACCAIIDAHGGWDA